MATAAEPKTRTRKASAAVQKPNITEQGTIAQVIGAVVGARERHEPCVRE